MTSNLDITEVEKTEEEELAGMKELLERGKKGLLHKEQIRLLFPYSENAELKKKGAQWNADNKIWYYPSLDGTLPDNLKPYKCYFIDVDYSDKEYLKPILPSMKYDKGIQKWLVNQEDYEKFVKLNIEKIKSLNILKMTLFKKSCLPAYSKLLEEESYIKQYLKSTYDIDYLITNDNQPLLSIVVE